GRLALAHLGEERFRVLLADAVGDHRPVERLLFTEHRPESLALAPRAHDRHGPLPGYVATPGEYSRGPTDPSQYGLSLRRHAGEPRRRRAKGACAGPSRAL